MLSSCLSITFIRLFLLNVDDSGLPGFDKELDYPTIPAIFGIIARLFRLVFTDFAYVYYVLFRLSRTEYTCWSFFVEESSCNNEIGCCTEDRVLESGATFMDRFTEDWMKLSTFELSRQSTARRDCTGECRCVNDTFFVLSSGFVIENIFFTTFFYCFSWLLSFVTLHCLLLCAPPFFSNFWKL